MIKYFVIRYFRGTHSLVEMLKEYMLICRNAEGVHGWREVENPCYRLCVSLVFISFEPIGRTLFLSALFNARYFGQNLQLFDIGVCFPLS